MKLEKEVIALERDAPKLLQTREAAAKGDQEALRKYVLYSVLKQMRLRKDLTVRQQNREFKTFVTHTKLEVSLG